MLPSVEPNTYASESVKMDKEVLKVMNDLKKVQWHKYWSIFATKFIHALAITVYFFNCSILLKENYGITQKSIGYTIAFQSCVATIAGFFTGWINKTFYKNDQTHNFKYFCGFVVMTLSFASLCAASNLYYFIIGLIPLAISNSFLRIVETEILLAKSENEKGSLVGTSNSLASLARLTAPLSSGIINDVWGKESVMYYAALLSLSGTIVAGFISKQKEKIS